MAKRLGILGGTFNPIHNGHIEIAQKAREAMHLDQVMLLPDGEPPHKKAELESKAARLNMTVLGAYGCEGLYVSDMEIRRAGTTYTFDTLTELKKQDAEREIYFFIGGDTVDKLPTWHNAEQLGGLCRMLVVPRPGIDISALKKTASAVKAKIGLTVEVADCTGPEISSTDLRSALAENREEAEALLPTYTHEYIRMHGLYGSALHPVSEKLKQALKPSRYDHTLSVAETAVTLAYRFGADVVKAHTAGMLHDCAKYVSRDDSIKLIRSGRFNVKDDELSSDELLHAPAGAKLAETEYGITDPEILSAIRKHTIGGEGMTVLEKVVYLADMIEPLRKPFPMLEPIRKAAETDLDAAVLMAAQSSVDYVLRGGHTVNEETIKLINELTHK